MRLQTLLVSSLALASLGCNSAVPIPVVPGPGVFTFRAPTSRRYVFVTFMDRAILFSSLKGTLPWSYSNTYEDWYGAGLK